MPCNCRKCDCQDRLLCHVIESRLKSLACVFDHVANGSLAATDLAFTNFTAVANPICPKASTSLSTLFTLIEPTISLFNDITGEAASNCIPSANIATNAAWINTAVCIPTLNGACYACSSVAGTNVTLCDITTDSADATNYAAIAQNLRYIASVYGCQNE